MDEPVKIEGLADLEKTLGELSKATGRNVLKRALLDVGKPLAEEMARNAPRESARDSHNFADTIVASTKKPAGHVSPAKKAFIDARRAGASPAAARAAAKEAGKKNPANFAEAFVGPNRDPAAIQQEFGNTRHAAQPFARPSWDAMKRRMLARLEGAIGTELSKAILRGQRRAARLANRN